MAELTTQEAIQAVSIMKNHYRAFDKLEAILNLILRSDSIIEEKSNVIKKYDEEIAAMKKEALFFKSAKDQAEALYDKKVKEREAEFDRIVADYQQGIANLQVEIEGKRVELSKVKAQFDAEYVKQREEYNEKLRALDGQINVAKSTLIDLNTAIKKIKEQSKVFE